jgi:hypothetical protein
MKRFFGMMPSSEVKLEKTYVDEFGMKIMIQSSENGWSILYSDGSSEYQDVVDTVENNQIKH